MENTRGHDGVGVGCLYGLGRRLGSCWGVVQRLKGDQTDWGSGIRLPPSSQTGRVGVERNCDGTTQWDGRTQCREVI